MGDGVIDLFRPFIAPEAAEMVARTLTPDADGRVYVGEGPRVQEFEDAFGQLVGASNPRPLAMNSCTSALDLALHLAGVGLGSEVITTPLTCTATNGVIVNRGAKIVWADVDRLTGLIDLSDVACKITRRTKAIMAVDWAGRSCNYAALKRLSPAWQRIPVIQDAAHNLYVDMANRGDYVAWSFQAIKHLTTGDGGALLVPPQQYDRARLLRWYGLDRTSSADFRCAQDIKEAGYKYQLNDLAASIGLANLPHTPRVVNRYRENAAWYSENLQGVAGITLPPADPRSSWWIYCVLAADRASFIAHLAQRGISASPVHRRNDVHPAFSYPNGPLPGVDYFAEHEVAIPVGWWVTDRDRLDVAMSIKEWARSRTPELVAA